MLIDYKKFYNVWFYDNDMNLIEPSSATKQQAATLFFTVEYNFDEVPDLPLIELAKTLIKSVPENFIFIRSGSPVLNKSIENLCKEAGRPDIVFVDVDLDIDANWYEEFKNKICFFEARILHECYTMWKISSSNRPCGFIGNFIQLADLSIVQKTNMILEAGKPNWQLYSLYYNIPTRQIVDYCNENLIFPEFTLLLAKAFLKQVDLDNNWLNFRMTAQNKLGSTALGIALSPLMRHSFKELADIPNYPKYPGLITREYLAALMPLSSVLEA